VTPRPSGPVSNERSAVLAAQAEQMNLQVLAGLVGGTAVDKARARADVPLVDLSAVAAQNVGAVAGDGDIKIRSGAPVQAANKGGLTTLGDKRAESNSGPGKETAVAGPTGIAQVGTSIATVPVPGADGTVAGLRGRLRNCYQTGLLSDSTMSGKVVISARIGPNGEVTTSEIASLTGLSPAVGQCVAGVVKRATFNAPGGGGATIQIPVTFLPQTK
jgi:TonB family protein